MQRKQASKYDHAHPHLTLELLCYMGFVTPHSEMQQGCPRSMAMVSPRFPHTQQLDWLRRFLSLVQRVRGRDVWRS